MEEESVFTQKSKRPSIAFSDLSGFQLELELELELACNRGSCGKIPLKIFACEKIVPHEPRLQASSSSVPRIRIGLLSVESYFATTFVLHCYALRFAKNIVPLYQPIRSEIKTIYDLIARV